jgi:glycosyltransferase involved in cell wall biosynthesis
VAAVGTARALAERDDIRVIGVAALHREPAPAPYEPPVPVAQLKLPRLLLYQSWHYLRQPAVQRATGRVDLIHATTLALPPKSAPLVVTIHDLAFVKHPEYFTDRGVRFFSRGLELALKDADMVLCPSKATLNDCIDAGFEQERLEVVPLGISVDPVANEDVRRVASNYGLDRPYIMFSGTIEPRKNLRGLIQAFKRIDAEADLVVVGPKGWNEELNYLTGDGRHRVKVLGFVPSGDLGPLYAGAAVCCFPSFLEGFGFPVLEAMAYGAPVVTSRGTSTEEVAGEAAVLVDPRDPESIAAGLSSVLEDENLAIELRWRGHERAAAYSWANTAQRTIDAYRRVTV